VLSHLKAIGSDMVPVEERVFFLSNCKQAVGSRENGRLISYPFLINVPMKSNDFWREASNSEAR